MGHRFKSHRSPQTSAKFMYAHDREVLQFHGIAMFHGCGVLGLNGKSATVVGNGKAVLGEALDAHPQVSNARPSTFRPPPSPSLPLTLALRR